MNVRVQVSVWPLLSILVGLCLEGELLNHMEIILLTARLLSGRLFLVGEI